MQADTVSVQPFHGSLLSGLIPLHQQLVLVTF